MARMSWRMVAAALGGLGLAVLSAPAARVSAHEAVAAGLPPRNVQVVEITAERYSFTPSEIHATAGVPLEIRLESEDTDHGFRIIGTKIDLRIPKRGKGQATVTFDPPAPGRYRFECSHVCGAGHSFMRGTIVVTK
jgi:heme/copper-type cytochrome/quinol oxidase subunit 2